MSTQLAALSYFASQVSSAFGQLRLRWTAAGPTAHRHPGIDAADDVASVQALADRYRRSDPSFASDLYAAAERHERTAQASAQR